MIVRQHRAVNLLTATLLTLCALYGAHGVAANPDRDILLNFRNNIENWAVFQNASALRGWDEISPVCSWGGILCSDTERVTQLYLGCSLCNVKAMGNIHPSLASLDQLQVLRLDRNWFNGSLPKEFAYGFPNLVEMRLDFNSLTGSIPAEWGNAGAFPSLLRAHIGGNQLKGSLPEMQSGAMAELEVLGMQWNMLQGKVPSSWANLSSLRALWVRPGNYQLCGSPPPLAAFHLCKEVDAQCEITSSLGKICSLEVPVNPALLPPPTATATVLEAVLRIEGANIFPFTANNLNIFVSALVDLLPNITASDIVIGQVLPIVWAGPVNASSSGRQLATPMPWPVPNLQHVQPGPQVSMQNWVLDAVFDPVTVIEGGRRRLTGAWPRGGAASLGRRLLQGPAVNNVPTLPPGLQGAVFRPRPGFSNAAAPRAAAKAAVPAVAPEAVDSQETAEALPFGSDRPYGTPVPGGILIGADVPVELKTITNGNVSEAEAMVARVASSRSLVQRLQAGGLAVVHVMLVSCEPLDPSALPVRLRPQIINFTLPGQDSDSTAPAQQHFPQGLIVGIVLAVVGILLAVFAIATLIVHRWRKQRLHPSASPMSTLATAQSTEALKAAGSQALEVRLSSNTGTSIGTPGRLRTLASDMESSGGQLLGPPSDHSLSDTGTQVSDATLVARLGNEGLPAAAARAGSGQVEERQAAGLHASTSDRGQGLTEWAGTGQGLGSLGKQGSSIELPALPWSDWEISAEQITICKREDGSDWELGAGAFGKVFKALRGGVQVVAVKVLHDAEVGGVNFTREIAILKGCRHSNIVQFQGACVSGSRTMLVMEYVEGGDLWRALQREGSRVRSWAQQGKRVALDIARGLCFLHAHSIVLFDLKSHNVLLTRDGTAKIADVGLAKVLTQGYVSKLEEVAGTFAWAAPELLMGGRCSDKVDMFSFGVVLWELATCERPQRGQLRDVRVPEEVPEEVAQLINECLSYDPKLRPSAKQIYDRLQASALPRPQPPPPAVPGTPFAAAARAPDEQDSPLPGGDGAKEVRTEPLQRMPTPLGSRRLPVRSAFETDD